MEAESLIILVAIVLLVFYLTRQQPNQNHINKCPCGCGAPNYGQCAYRVARGQCSGFKGDIQEVAPDYSYDDYLVNEGLEKSVVESHNKFVDEIHHRTTGASAQSVLSGDVDVNPWVGLRRINYNAAFSQNDARTVSSESPDQMYDPTHFRL